jgi:hypothetical protein
LWSEYDRISQAGAFVLRLRQSAVSERDGLRPGVYVAKNEIESEVLRGLQDLLRLCTDRTGFTRKSNGELRGLWRARTGFRPDAADRLATIDKRIANIRSAFEDGLHDASWAHARLQELSAERAGLLSATTKCASPPLSDAAVVMDYRETEKLEGLPAERKRLLPAWLGEVVLKPEYLEVSISYRLPEAVMNGMVAGGGFEPPTLGL